MAPPTRFDAIKFASFGLLAAAAWAAGIDLFRAERIEAVRAVIDGSSPTGRDQFLAGREQRIADDTGDLSVASPVEAQALATLWIDQAAASPPYLRLSAFAHAEALLARLRTARPAAPGAALLQIRLNMVRYGGPEPSSIAAFARSYRQAGFLRDEGLWRLAFAATYWSLLPGDTRAAVVDEAVWLARLDGRLRAAVDHLVAGTPLALPVELRLMS